MTDIVYDERPNTVVEANKLVTAQYKLKLNEMRIVHLAATKIDSRPGKTHPEQSIRIYVTEFVKTYNVATSNAYRDMKNAVKSIMRSPIIIEDPNNPGRIREYSWLIMNEYFKDDGTYVEIKFSPDVARYLYDLSANYTSSTIEHLAHLDSNFSSRLYRWLKQYKGIGKYKSKLGHYTTVLTIQEMKERTGLSNSYPKYTDFKKRVLKPAVDKINKHTDVYVMFEPIKSGHTTTAIRFLFTDGDNNIAEPKRPRLKRRPKVLAGSAAEGDWMRENFKLLNDYRVALRKYDEERDLTLPDLRKLAEYAKIAHPELQHSLNEKIKSRERK